ncbi:MAG: type II toxin-antitoxin system RelE/ParE family toxin [Hydrogenovibrio sp.]|nr:type II toxin-antitoxin system RelE/ParE family toxin [Hydrogenovibrio sp.]MDR9499473.1 type II toxin-antitoxin system RelE/ParE family toxin [Hydrogenovibrio sp.]
MQIQQTKRFQKALKKLHASQKQDLDNAIKGLMQQPDMGKTKR